MIIDTNLRMTQFRLNCLANEETKTIIRYYARTAHQRRNDWSGARPGDPRERKKK